MQNVKSKFSAVFSELPGRQFFCLHVLFSACQCKHTQNISPKVRPYHINLHIYPVRMDQWAL